MAEIDYNTVIAAMRKGNPGDPGSPGVPGIGWAGTAITTENLNTLTANGIYNISTVPANWQELNYPANISGNVMVMNRTANRATQLYIPNTVAGDWDRGIWIRNQTGVNNEFARKWKFIGSQRTDNSAGKAIYTWDEANNTEQLIYGDTGWRSVPTLLFGDFVNTSVIIRRQGYQVTVGFDGVKSDTISGHTPFFLPPQGFKPDTVAGTGNQRYTLVSDLNGSNIKIVSPDANTNSLRFLSYVTGLVLHGSVTYMTREPWPTTLPGTAVGAIPNT